MKGIRQRHIFPIIKYNMQYFISAFLYSNTTCSNTQYLQSNVYMSHISGIRDPVCQTILTTHIMMYLYYLYIANYKFADRILDVGFRNTLHQIIKQSTLTKYNTAKRKKTTFSSTPLRLSIPLIDFSTTVNDIMKNSCMLHKYFDKKVRLLCAAFLWYKMRSNNKSEYIFCLISCPLFYTPLIWTKCTIKRNVINSHLLTKLKRFSF